MQGDYVTDIKSVKVLNPMGTSLWAIQNTAIKHTAQLAGRTNTLQGVSVFPDVTYSAIVMLVTSIPYL